MTWQTITLPAAFILVSACPSGSVSTVSDRQTPATELQQHTLVAVTVQGRAQAQAARWFHRRLQTGMFPSAR
ncbi:hypothetical protein XJ27_12630 [Xanthomonas hortorum]|nr:hypothetical protein XJ27_12630 [Xanthomonas hortorum]